LEPGFDPYRELGLSPEAASEPELIRAAFKALARKYHPDASPNAAEKAAAEEKMRRLNEAQRLLLSGEYRPPPPVLAPLRTPPPDSSFMAGAAWPAAGIEQDSTASSKSPARGAESPSARPPAVRPGPAPGKRRAVPLAPLAVAGVLLLASLALPSIFRRDHLAQARLYEDKGQLELALDEANLAVADDPRQGSPYLLRARLWQKLGKPDRAATDLANARGLVPPAEYEAALKETRPTSSPTPRATRSPELWTPPKGGG
jgi:tetratricopeptide (TPR) repeat protein